MLHATGVDGPCQQHSGPVVICISAVCNSQLNPILNPSRKDFVTSACSFGDYVTSSVSQGSHKRLSWGGGKAYLTFVHRSLILPKLCRRLVFCLLWFLLRLPLDLMHFVLSYLEPCLRSTFIIYANTSS